MNISTEPKKQYKYILLLAMLYVTADLASNIVAYKMVLFGPLVQTGAVFIFPWTYFLGDILAEVYGYKVSRQVVWFDLVCDFLFSLAVIWVIHMPSPASWHDQNAYNTVLDPLLKVNFGSLIAMWAGSFINIYAISKLKIIMNGKHFWLRSIASTAIGEAVVVIIGFSIVFSGYTSVHNILELMVADYSLKLLFAGITVLPATLLQSFLKQKEGVDVYDYHTNFNPFKLNAS